MARYQSIDSDDDDRVTAADLKYGAHSVMSLIGPVSICLLAVVATVRSVSYFAENPEQQYLYVLLYIKYTPGQLGMARIPDTDTGHAALSVSPFPAVYTLPLIHTSLVSSRL